MSEVTLVAITTAASIVTVLISRIRFIFRPCSDDPENGARVGALKVSWTARRTRLKSLSMSLTAATFW